jgi:fructose-1,6-bisphosphatase II
MLYIGERVGSAGRTRRRLPQVDIAVDPLEGTNLCATGAPDSISVIAIAADGRFLNAPDTYMEKIAVGPEARGAIDLQRDWTWNLHAIAEAKGMRVEDLTTVVLDRPRHADIIEAVRAAGGAHPPHPRR